jgi:alpha-D-ribose 1-methylphosphonate 5-triphosphate synthase subunit PhnL
MTPTLQVVDLYKSFTLHVQGGVNIPVLDGLELEVHPGECVALSGPSGTGKSTLLRAIYANYKPQSGRILVRHQSGVVDMVGAEPRLVLEVRKYTMGFVSQFLRVIPRVPSLEIVGEPLRGLGLDSTAAAERASAMLARLRIPQRLYHLAPATFSGGEQQRINIARTFIVSYPILLLDEPTASLDKDNRFTVIDLIREAKTRGAAIVGTFHDEEVRHAVSDRIFEMVI